MPPISMIIRDQRRLRLPRSTGIPSVFVDLKGTDLNGKPLTGDVVDAIYFGVVTLTLSVFLPILTVALLI